jgi:V8-like Glu-specific endopeptidase
MVVDLDHPVVLNAYLSHSYRGTDMETNDMFWSVFAEHGFSFMVDARSDYFSLLYLETMMRRSHCFVAIIPYRDQGPGYSPYIKFEFDMARLARKPRFVVRSVDTSGDAFSITAHDLEQLFENAWRRNSLPELKDNVVRFRQQVEAQGARAVSRSHRLGLILGSGRHRPASFPEIRGQLTDHASNYGYELEVLEPADLDYGSLAALDHYDLLVIDASGHHVPIELFAFAHSRLIPTIKLIPLAEGQFPNAVRLPLISQSLRRTPTDPFIYWRTPSELLVSVDRELNELRRLYTAEPEQHAKTAPEAQRYFNSLGRARLRVFLSHAGEDQELGVALSEALDRRYVDHFYYKDPHDLPAGIDWRLRIGREVSHECGVFVMLISGHYWQSKWCDQEWRTAKARFDRNEMVIFPFKVGPGRDERLEGIQAPDLTEQRYPKLGIRERAEMIADLIAEQLDRDGPLKEELLRAERVATLHMEAIDVQPETMPEAVIGNADALPAQWLLEGGIACRSVARLTIQTTRGKLQRSAKDRRRTWHGTGWLLDHGILVTNYHVLAGSDGDLAVPDDLVSQANNLTAQFGYTEFRGQTRQFNVQELLAFDQALDYAAMRLREVATDERPRAADDRPVEDPMSRIEWWGRLEWHPASSLTSGDRLNIIQHPDAGPMMVAFRRNTFERHSSDQRQIEYTTDTSEGSSGSPVFDDAWLVRAIHHGHVLASPERGSTMRKARANVGIPIDAIVRHIQAIRPDLALPMRRSARSGGDGEPPAGREAG